MAGNAREPLFLLTTVDDKFAEEHITKFVKDAVRGAEGEDIALTLFNKWKAAKDDINCAGVCFKGTTVFTATKLDKNSTATD